MRGRHLLIILFDGFDEIFFQEADDLFHVPAGDHFHGDFQGFVSDVDVRTGCEFERRGREDDLDKTRRISITKSSRTPSCSWCNSLTLSRTMSLTLLSDSLMANSMNFEAAANVTSRKEWKNL